MRRALTASLVFLAIVLGWVAPRVLTYVCSMGDGSVRTECCCAPDHAEAREAPEPAFERPGCCEVRSEHAVVAMSLAPELDRASIAAPVALDVTPSWAALHHARALRVSSAPRGPPRVLGPPAYLRLRILLI